MATQTTVTFLFLILLFLSGPLGAQLPAQAPAGQTPVADAGVDVASLPISQTIFLDVKDLGTNLSSSVNWQSAWGSYSKNYQKARGLELNFRNSAKLPGEYLVEWYFFATPVKGGTRFLHDRGSKTLSIKPGGMEKVTILSEELQSHKTQYSSGYYYSGYSYRSGYKPEGWAVTVKVGDKIIRTKTANAQIEAIFNKPELLQSYIDKLGSKVGAN